MNASGTNESKEGEGNLDEQQERETAKSTTNNTNTDVEKNGNQSEGSPSTQDIEQGVPKSGQCDKEEDQVKETQAPTKQADLTEAKISEQKTSRRQLVDDIVKNRPKTYRGGQLQFPWMLHKMLEDSVIYNFTHLISWMPSGRVFRVHNQNDFATLVLPRYFRQTAYKSFVRSLNLWGFTACQLCCGRDYVSGYFHQHFVQGNPSRAHNMVRVVLRNRPKGKGCVHCRYFDGNPKEREERDRRAAAFTAPTAPPFAAPTFTAASGPVAVVRGGIGKKSSEKRKKTDQKAPKKPKKGDNNTKKTAASKMLQTNMHCTASFQAAAAAKKVPSPQTCNAMTRNVMAMQANFQANFQTNLQQQQWHAYGHKGGPVNNGRALSGLQQKHYQELQALFAKHNCELQTLFRRQRLECQKGAGLSSTPCPESTDAQRRQKRQRAPTTSEGNGVGLGYGDGAGPNQFQNYRGTNNAKRISWTHAPQHPYPGQAQLATQHFQNQAPSTRPLQVFNPNNVPQHHVAANSPQPRSSPPINNALCPMPQPPRRLGDCNTQGLNSQRIPPFVDNNGRQQEQRWQGQIADPMMMARENANHRQYQHDAPALRQPQETMHRNTSIPDRERQHGYRPETIPGPHHDDVVPTGSVISFDQAAAAEFGASMVRSSDVAVAQQEQHEYDNDDEASSSSSMSEASSASSSSSSGSEHSCASHDETNDLRSSSCTPLLPTSSC
mmetsp:Transcript_270/g.584  ORF Transcript_270/g.584 Transcript_270/m.584 type:complete len:721 (+) Transcript_270:97-2259(+)|eukprot:CAMPEP_0119546522 /NCGR_PEP_ID=MMETSP1352-20130426/907_1 /TAXON_ID=265584 /ORGANISM="Stauroneis constricta, Strain CCMP1120" /LENGTH=720 /DNA_ID=CAMNT_0007591233 /DNA_START=69 /DNA_END=2231 /DNA_ORIENTATION=-